jgi:hypothetical protein
MVLVRSEIICEILVPDATNDQNSYREVILGLKVDLDQYNGLTTTAVIVQRFSGFHLYCEIESGRYLYS